MKQYMDLIVRPSLRMEHAELHRKLATPTKLPGPVGEAARAAAKVLQPLGEHLKMLA